MEEGRFGCVGIKDSKRISLIFVWILFDFMLMGFSFWGFFIGYLVFWGMWLGLYFKGDGKLLEGLK